MVNSMEVRDIFSGGSVDSETCFASVSALLYSKRLSVLLVLLKHLVNIKFSQELIRINRY